MREKIIGQINNMLASLPDETLWKVYQIIQRLWLRN